MKVVLLALASFLASAQAVSFYEVVSDEWVTWKLFHGKNYSNEVEDKFRLKIFMENKANIAKHNARAHRGEKTYLLKMNSYGDLVSNSRHVATSVQQGGGFDRGGEAWDMKQDKSKYFNPALFLYFSFIMNSLVQ